MTPESSPAAESSPLAPRAEEAPVDAATPGAIGSRSEPTTLGRGMSPRSRRIIVLAGLLILAAAALLWWRLRPAPPTPPMPGEIADTEVRAAIEAARQVVLQQPHSAAAWGELGKILLTHLFDQEARTCFAEAERLNPAEPLWPYAQGVIALKRTPETAVSLLQRAVAAAERSRHRAALSLQLAEALLERGNLDEAERLFIEVERDLHDQAEEARTAFGLGLLAKSRGNRTAAAKFMRAAQASPFARKKATAQLAALARYDKDLPSAETYENETVALPDDPPWPDPLLDELVGMQVGRRGLERRAGLLEQQGRFQEVADLYLEQLTRERNAAFCIGAGINLARVGDFDQGLALLREAVTLEPKNAQARFSLAHVLFARARRAWNSNSDAPEVRQGFVEAVEQACLAAESRPDHAGAYLIWGLGLKYLGKGEAAVEPLQKGVACSPADFELQLVLGEVLLDLDRRDEAAIHLHNAARLKPAEHRPSTALERLNKKKM